MTSRSCLLSALIIAVIFVGSFSVGCRGELDPAHPEDSYRMFRDALLSGDAEQIWTRTDEETRAYFEAHYMRLEKMNDLIERYLPLTDHHLARQQSGVELLEEIGSGEELFRHIYSPGALAGDAAIDFGSQAKEIQMAEDEQSALIVTRAGQEFVLIRQEDGLWYINLAKSGDFLADSFQWLADNEVALEQTVEDLIAEERQVREQIIAKLMDRQD